MTRILRAILFSLFLITVAHNLFFFLFSDRFDQFIFRHVMPPSNL